MTKPPQVSGVRTVRALLRAGWTIVGGSGSHRKLRHPDKPGRIVIVAVHGSRPIPPGTLLGILEDAGITIDELKELL